MKVLRKSVLPCIALFLVACDSDSPTTSNNNNTNTTPACLYPFSVWLSVPDFFPKVHGVCESVLWRRMGADPGAWFDQHITSAQFCVSENKAASVEYVAVNGIQLRGDSSLYLTTDEVPLWAYHVWSFGGGDVPDVHDSIQTTREFTITSPTYLTDTVSKNGFTIRYDPTGTDSILVFFIYDPYLSREYDPTITDTNLTISNPMLLKSTGTTAISPSMFSASPYSPPFPDRGIAVLYVIAYRKKTVTAGGKQYLLRAGERCETRFFFRK